MGVFEWCTIVHVHCPCIWIFQAFPWTPNDRFSKCQWNVTAFSSESLLFVHVPSYHSSIFSFLSLSLLSQWGKQKIATRKCEKIKEVDGEENGAVLANGDAGELSASLAQAKSVPFRSKTEVCSLKTWRLAFHWLNAWNGDIPPGEVCLLC